MTNLTSLPTCPSTDRADAYRLGLIDRDLVEQGFNPLANAVKLDRDWLPDCRTAYQAARRGELLPPLLPAAAAPALDVEDEDEGEPIDLISPDPTEIILSLGLTEERWQELNADLVRDGGLLEIYTPTAYRSWVGVGWVNLAVTSDGRWDLTDQADGQVYASGRIDRVDGLTLWVVDTVLDDDHCWWTYSVEYLMRYLDGLGAQA